MTAKAVTARLRPARSSLLAALRASLAAVGDERTDPEIAGLAGLTFRLQVDAAVTPASVSGFPWMEELPAALSRLGYASQCTFADPAVDPRFPALVDRALGLTVEGLRRGRPTILWGVHLPEFGTVIAADVAARVLVVSGVLDGHGGDEQLSFDRIGRGDAPLLFAQTIGEREPVAPTATYFAAVTHAVTQLAGAGPRYGGFHTGLAAYSAWTAALRGGRIDPAGHAYTAQVACELRALAPLFLERATSVLGAAASAALLAAAHSARRVSAALVELAGCAPFPLPEGAILTTSARLHHAALLDAAASAEAEVLACLEKALLRGRRAAYSERIRIVDAGAGEEGRLFSCVDELPVMGLGAEAAELALAVAPRLGCEDALRAKLALAEGAVAGHILYTGLDIADAAIDADGDVLYVFCLWVARRLRGAGVGRRLVVALHEEAAATDIDGLLVEATGQEIFLHHEGYEALGFREIDRTEDDVRLLLLPVSGRVVRARLRRPSPEVRRRPRLPVIVAEDAARSRPCPLLLRSWRNIATAARRAIAVGGALTVDDPCDQGHGVTVGSRRLPLGYVPLETAERALLDAAAAWTSAEGSGGRVRP